MRVIGVLNRDGGTFKTTDVPAFAAHAVDVFSKHGKTFEPRVVAGSQMLAALRQAASEADVLLAGGGDGTVSAAAGIAYQQKVPLAVLPAGTMNLFARSLQIPLNLNAALEVLATGDIATVDVATANGRPFVHQFSVGIHAKLVKLRERRSYGSRLGKMAASMRAASGVVLRPPNFVAEVLTDTGIVRRSMAGLSVSNNPLDEGHLPIADRLDRGILGLYIIPPLTSGGIVRLSWGLLRGKFRSLAVVIDREAREVVIRFPRKKANAVAVIDGELIRLPDRVDLKIHPGALQVLLPKDAIDTVAPSSAELAPA